MGGRGASSSITKGSKTEKQGQDSLERYLGKKNENPLSVSQALIWINPNYSSGEEWQYNCQSCATSFEATQRGYDVKAVPHGKNDPYFTDADGKQHYWYDVYEGEKRTTVYSSNYSHGFYGIEGKTKVYNTANQISKEMKSYGDGARATLQVAWKGKNAGGHILNVINIGGAVGCVDAQTGKVYSLTDILSRAKKGSALTRVDNLKFNSNIQYLTKKMREE